MHSSRSFTSVVLATALVCLWSTASPAAAQSFGVRGGVSVAPDQVYVGGHYESVPLIENLHFKPNVELGFGDDVTALTFNAEFIYKLPIESPLTLYAGGGPAINFYSFDFDAPGLEDETETDPGLNFLFGAETPGGLFFEVKVGAIDSPDFKVGVGYSWR